MVLNTLLYHVAQREVVSCVGLKLDRRQDRVIPNRLTESEVHKLVYKNKYN